MRIGPSDLSPDSRADRPTGPQKAVCCGVPQPLRPVQARGRPGVRPTLPDQPGRDGPRRVQHDQTGPMTSLGTATAISSNTHGNKDGNDSPPTDVSGNLEDHSRRHATAVDWSNYLLRAHLCPWNATSRPGHYERQIIVSQRRARQIIVSQRQANMCDDAWRDGLSVTSMKRCMAHPWHTSRKRPATSGECQPHMAGRLPTWRPRQ